MECLHGHYQNNSGVKTHIAFHGLSDSDANCCLLGTARVTSTVFIVTGAEHRTEGNYRFLKMTF